MKLKRKGGSTLLTDELELELEQILPQFSNFLAMQDFPSVLWLTLLLLFS